MLIANNSTSRTTQHPEDRGEEMIKWNPQWKKVNKITNQCRRHKLGSLRSQTTTTTTTAKHDGREQLRAGTQRSLARLLILSSRTETMRRLGPELVWCVPAYAPPTVGPSETPLWSPDETRLPHRHPTDRSRGWSVARRADIIYGEWCVASVNTDSGAAEAQLNFGV